MRSSNLPFFDVACAVIVRGQKVLIALREDGSYYGGYWEFPGGKIEKDELPEEALSRELLEELGIRAGIPRAWKVLNYFYPKRHVNLRFFICYGIRGNPQPIGCDAVKWVSACNLNRYKFLPANQPILDALTKSSDVTVFTK